MCKVGIPTFIQQRQAEIQRSARQCGTIEKKLRGSNVPFIQRYSRKNC